MEKNKKIVNNKLIKFLLVLKKFWYVTLVSVIAFGIAGYFIGNTKSDETISFKKKTDYINLKTNVIISDETYKDFSETFNNTCFYFMDYNEVKLSAFKSVNPEITDSEALKSIKISQNKNMSNMVEVNIKYNSAEEAKSVLDSFITKAESYLNKTLKNNMDQIKITQAGVIEYESYEEIVNETKTNVVKYVILGVVAGFAFAIILLYFVRFYFLIHCPTDVVKNFEIDYIGTIKGNDELSDFVVKNKDLYFCNSGKEKLIDNINCYTKEEIFNNGIDFCGDKKLVIIIKDDKDTFFYIEKLQLLLKNKIRGFIIYK